MNGLTNCYTAVMEEAEGPLENEVNKYDYDPNSPGNVKIRGVIRELMDDPPFPNQRWWTIRQLEDILIEKGIWAGGQCSISARVRDLRKKKNGQYPVEREDMWSEEDEGKISHYRLGEKGTGVLNKKKKCKWCDPKDEQIKNLQAEIDRRGVWIERYHLLCGQYQEDIRFLKEKLASKV